MQAHVRDKEIETLKQQGRKAGATGLERTCRVGGPLMQNVEGLGDSNNGRIPRLRDPALVDGGRNSALASAKARRVNTALLVLEKAALY